ncbi:MAG: hypothetical protein WBG89_03785 [Ornithinimicrobium sp.]
MTGTLRLRLVDDARADASTTTVSTSVDAALRWASESPVLRTLEVPADGPPTGHALQAHFDLDGSGEVSVGDYVTMQRYAVPSGGGSSFVLLELLLVR